jgi:hypothetical protein
MWTVFAFHYRWLGLHNSKIYFLFSIKAWHIYFPLTFSGYLLLRKREEKKERVPSTSTCMFNFHSTFIYFCTLSLIVRHYWVELEVPLHISFSCSYSLKFDSLPRSVAAPSLHATTAATSMRVEEDGGCAHLAPPPSTAGRSHHHRRGQRRSEKPRASLGGGEIGSPLESPARATRG